MPEITINPPGSYGLVEVAISKNHHFIDLVYQPKTDISVLKKIDAVIRKIDKGYVIQTDKKFEEFAGFSSNEPETPLPPQQKNTGRLRLRYYIQGIVGQAGMDIADALLASQFLNKSDAEKIREASVYLRVADSAGKGQIGRL